MNRLSILLRTAAAACLATAGPSHAATLLQADFNAANPFSGFAAYRTAGSVTANASLAPAGTIDTVGSATPSGALRLAVDSAGASGPWSAGLSTGRVAVTNTEPDLAQLTLAFSLSASLARPVLVRIESFSPAGVRTGGLAALVHPAAADFFQRYALDLGTMTPFGAGSFQALAPQIQLSFEIASDLGGDAWPAAAGHELRIDNVHLASPAFYVSPTGHDTSNDGRTPTTALRTPQRALDLAQAGDIILLQDGTYQGGLNPVAAFVRAGTPAGWISLKNFPGHRPTLTSNGWNIVSIARGANGSPSATVLAYLEVRGLHVRGEGDVVRQKFPEAIGRADSRTNSNGIAVDGRYMTNIPHHFRFADNVVEYCPGQGIGALEADWVTIENNITRYNCWTTIYGTSGLSLLGASNFDASDNVYKLLVRNNVTYRNETYEKWAAINRYSDGNGLIIDVNRDTASRPGGVYLGRTLVQNNLSVNNGGSGIHCVEAHRVDIVNNTAYLNSASRELEYSQMFTYSGEDVRFVNNILVAPVANVAAGERPEPVNRLSGPSNRNVVFLSNVYFGGNIAPTLGTGDVVADPRFVRAELDPLSGDFQLQGHSPAIDSGVIVTFAPRRDLAGRLRPQGAAPDRGAYEAASFVLPAPNPRARLVNLSVRTSLVAGETLIAGFGVNGGAKPLLLRAVGPALAALVESAHPDPRLACYDDAGVLREENNDWSPALAARFASVGAFALAAGSRDAALERTIIGAQTAHLSGPGTGTVLFEAYDLQPDSGARLANLSARQRVSGGTGALTAGFVIGGDGEKGILIRGIGPALRALGVGGALGAARLEIFSGATKIAETDGWSPALGAVFASVGAFALPAASADTALALTLRPGAYTAQLTSPGGAGDGLIEIYELP